MRGWEPLDKIYRTRLLACLPLFILCLFLDSYTFFTVHVLAASRDQDNDKARLFHTFFGMFWALGIFVASYFQGSIPKTSTALFSTSFSFRSIANLIFVYYQTLVPRYAGMFVHGLVFGTTLVQGVWITMRTMRRSTSNWMAIILLTSIIAAAYLPSVVDWNSNFSNPTQATVSIWILVSSLLDLTGVIYGWTTGVYPYLPWAASYDYDWEHLNQFEPMIQWLQVIGPSPLAQSASTNDFKTSQGDKMAWVEKAFGPVPPSKTWTAVNLWGVRIGFMQISCLVPTLVELAATQKPSASSETWVLALVTIIPFASYVAIKSDVDMHIPALTSMALSFCAAIVFTGTTGRFCWPHLAFWLIVCSIMAFFFDEMREITKAADATPSMLNGNQLVTPCARLTQAVATGCFAGSVLWACFEILLPPGPSSSVTKAAVSMLLSSSVFVLTAALLFRNGIPRLKS